MLFKCECLNYNKYLLKSLDGYHVCRVSTYRGMTYTAVKKWFELANIQFFSSTTYYNYQSSLILPPIETMFLNSLDQSIQGVIARGMKLLSCAALFIHLVYIFALLHFVFYLQKHIVVCLLHSECLYRFWFDIFFEKFRQWSSYCWGCQI